MADRERRTFSGRTGIKTGTAGEGTGAKGNGSHNIRRQKLYATNPEYADRAKKASLATYRKTHPLPASKLSNGLLSSGQQREVFIEGMQGPVVIEAFTVPETAVALGRSELCVKRWIADGIVPPPLLRDTTRNYRHYSVGELRIIAEELRRHEREFKYLSSAHTATITALWQRMQGYRATHI